MSNRSSKNFLLELVALCYSASERAGILIREILKTGKLNVVNKGQENTFDPQTEADRSAQLCIIGKLSEAFPHLKVIGEEGDLCGCASDSVLSSIFPNPEILKSTCPPAFCNLTENDVVVWVDPLDGTGALYKGILHQVTVSIGIATIEGQPIAGVVHQPFYVHSPIDNEPKDYESAGSRTIWGIVGSGVFGLKPRKDLRVASSVALISLSHSTKDDHNIAKALDLEKIICASGAVYKALCVLEDEVDVLLYCSDGTKKWDTCATDAFFRAVGGRLTDIYGHEYNYEPKAKYNNPGGVLASRQNHENYVSKINNFFR